MQKISRKQRKSQRLNDFDYAMPGYYFVTICTKDKVNFFDDIHDGKMILNRAGQSALEIWKSVPDHYSNVNLDEFVTMPNHIHGVIVIQENASYKDVGTGQCPVYSLGNSTSLKRTGQCPVPTKKDYGLLSKSSMLLRVWFQRK